MHSFFKRLITTKDDDRAGLLTEPGTLFVLKWPTTVSNEKRTSPSSSRVVFWLNNVKAIWGKGILMKIVQLRDSPHMLSHPSTRHGNGGIRLVLVSIRLVGLGDSWFEPILETMRELFHSSENASHHQSKLIFKLMLNLSDSQHKHFSTRSLWPKLRSIHQSMAVFARFLQSTFPLTKNLNKAIKFPIPTTPTLVLTSTIQFNGRNRDRRATREKKMRKETTCAYVPNASTGSRWLTEDWAHAQASESVQRCQAAIAPASPPSFHIRKSAIDKINSIKLYSSVHPLWIKRHFA